MEYPLMTHKQLIQNKAKQKKHKKQSNSASIAVSQNQYFDIKLTWKSYWVCFEFNF